MDLTDKWLDSMLLLTELRSRFVKMCKLAHSLQNVVLILFFLIHVSSYFTHILPIFFNSNEKLVTLSQDTAHSCLHFLQLCEACRMNFTRFVIILAEGS